MTEKPLKPESSADLSAVIEFMASKFRNHPGFMATSTGFEVLHADWPAYPTGHGWEHALNVLAEFPGGTEFYRVDSIDQCSLFVVGKPKSRDRKSDNAFHVAAWDEDLVDLRAKGFVDGVGEKDEYFVDIRGAVALTPAGANAALALDLVGDLPSSLCDRALDHLVAGRFDSAARDASILIETRLKDACGSTRYGQALVEECFAPGGSLVPPGMPNPERLQLRHAFKTYFAFVRNEYAHSFPPTSLVTASRVVRKSAALLQMIEALKAARAGG